MDMFTPNSTQAAENLPQHFSLLRYRQPVQVSANVLREQKKKPVLLLATRALQKGYHFS